MRYVVVCPPEPGAEGVVTQLTSIGSPSITLGTGATNGDDRSAARTSAGFTGHGGWLGRTQSETTFRARAAIPEAPSAARIWRTWRPRRASCILVVRSKDVFI